MIVSVYPYHKLPHSARMGAARSAHLLRSILTIVGKNSRAHLHLFKPQSDQCEYVNVYQRSLSGPPCMLRGGDHRVCCAHHRGQQRGAAELRDRLMTVVMKHRK